MSGLPAVEGWLPEAPPGETPGRDSDAATAAGVRAYLKALRDHLEHLHRRGASGREVNEANSDAVDRLTRRLFALAESLAWAAEAGARLPVALVAVGGYARREMSICSDVDLLFLHDGELSPRVGSLAERIQYWLWDAGVPVGGAVRSAAETVALAREDVTVGTAVLDTRFLGGDAGLFHDLGERIRRELLADPARFIERQREVMAARHAKYGDSLYLLQPNLKEGAGGLRDYHAAYWVARAVLPDLRSLPDLLHVGLLDEREMQEYLGALEFLWRVRNELHLRARRRLDQLNFDHQEQIAEAFGYRDDGHVLPVERFMGDYYRAARSVRNLSEIVVEQCTVRCRPQAPAAEPVVVEDGFLVVDGELEIPHPAELRRRPVRLLTAFAVAQGRRASLSRAARRMIRAQLDLVDDSLRRDPEAAATLLRILDSEHRVMRSLMEMNEVGLLGRFLPEWEHIVCRWQHVMYHTYTVDVHSIFLVEELRRLWRGKYEAALPELTELMRSVTDRPALFLGCLLHDIGKGRGGDHSNRGEALARVCLERLGMPEARRERVAFLVRTHLLMSHVAQRRDLADPKVIVEFARTVGDRENLRNLYLLTFADTRASSAGAWTEWKGQLLRELYERTADFLESGRDDPSRALEQIEARVERRRDAARAELRALGVGEPKIDAFFAMMPRRYFVAHTPRQIARHARLVLGFGGARRMASAVREMRGDFTEFLFCAPDQHGLYALVAGTLTASGLNIIGSHVYTTRTGLALEVYRVSTPPGGPAEKALAWSEFETLLLDVLEGRRDLGGLLRARRRPVGRPASPSRQPPSVHVSNEEADLYTIVDVAANDRMGLLYDLVRTIADHDLEIYISKATTILDQAADTFYVRDAAGKKLGDPARLEALERDLLAVAAGEAADG